MERLKTMFDGASSARILVVDDEPGILRALKRALEESEFVVECAENAEQGLRMFGKGSFDVVVSDYRMDNMNGIDMLGKMASINPTISGILLTGFADLDVAMSAINEGKVHAFLTKPWDDNVLLLSIRQALERQKLYAENMELRNALFLQKLSTAVASAVSAEQVMEVSLQHLNDEFDFCFSSAFLIEPTNKKKLNKVAGAWTHAGILALSEVGSKPSDLLDAALSERVPQMRNIHPDGEPQSSGRAVAVEVTIPLLFGGRVAGVLYFLQSGASEAQRRTRIEMFKAIGSCVGMAMENAMLRERSMEQEKMAAVGLAITCLSHDIRNILTPIVSGAYLLQETFGGEKNLAFSNTCNLITKGAGHLLDLVGELLDFAKPKKPIFRSYDLVQLLERVSEEARVVAQSKSIEVSLKVHARPIDLKLDSVRFYRSLSNIALNGLESMENGGTLSIETRESEAPPSMIFPGNGKTADPPRVLQISISDTGEGIQPEVLNEIFAPFFTTKKSKGTGLGLAIAKQIVEEHGGLVHVDSKPSKRTTFTIFLPLSQRATDNRVPRSESAEELEGLKGAGTNKTAAPSSSSRTRREKHQTRSKTHARAK